MPLQICPHGRLIVDDRDPPALSEATLSRLRSPEVVARTREVLARAEQIMASIPLLLAQEEEDLGSVEDVLAEEEGCPLCAQEGRGE